MFGEKSKSVCSAVVENVGNTSEISKQYTNPHNSMKVGSQPTRIQNKTETTHNPQRYWKRRATSQVE